MPAAGRTKTAQTGNNDQGLFQYANLAVAPAPDCTVLDATGVGTGLDVSAEMSDLPVPCFRPWPPALASLTLVAGEPPERVTLACSQGGGGTYDTAWWIGDYTFLFHYDELDPTSQENKFVMKQWTSGTGPIIATTDYTNSDPVLPGLKENTTIEIRHAPIPQRGRHGA